jgi:CHAT domain-containing protein
MDDRRTADFMVELYRRILDGKEGREEAVRGVKLEMMKKGIHPYFWGGFVYYGE